jgi:ketopantoate hydroxymethyltransferase
LFESEKSSIVDEDVSGCETDAQHLYVVDAVGVSKSSQNICDECDGRRIVREKESAKSRHSAEEKKQQYPTNATQRKILQLANKSNSN